MLGLGLEQVSSRAAGTLALGLGLGGARWMDIKVLICGVLCRVVSCRVVLCCVVLCCVVLC